MLPIVSPSPKPILVTGGSGFIGTHLCRELRARGFAVDVLDRLDPKTSVEGVRYFKGDVRDVEKLRARVAEASAVYHLAATVSVPLCQGDPVESYSNNFTATLQVLEAIRAQAQASGQAPIPLVFASTAAVYGSQGDDGRALKESDTAPSFSSFYAAQKHASEKAIELYGMTAGVPATVFRFFNVFGPGQDPSSPYSGVITLFLKYASEKKALPLNAGGTQTRDFVSVKDVARACADALKQPREAWKAAPINLGSGTSMTVRKLAEIIRDELFADQGGVEIVDAPARPGDVMHSLANIERARTQLGFGPERLSAGHLKKILSDGTNGAEGNRS